MGKAMEKILNSRTDPRPARTGESKIAYDPKTGRVIAQIDPEQRATRYAYYPADHPSAGKLAYSANAEGKKQHVAYTTRGEQRAVWGESVQPLLYDYNEYGEMVGMKTFQTLPNGDPSLEEDKGAKTAWHFHEATGSLLKKEYADGHGPTYAYTEAGQLKERQWARTVGQAPRLPTDDAPAKAAAPLTTAYTYDPATLLLTKSTATDGTTVTYEYNPEGQLAKVTDATGSREFTYDIRGQILKESVTLITGADTAPINYEIRRSYTSLGQPSSVHLVSTDGETVSLDHKVDYSWNAHNQLASVKSLAGEFVYGYATKNPALLTKMTGPVHEVETTYEPHRNLITGMTNRILTPSHEATKGRVVSSYAYGNDVLGRRETISHGGEAFAMLKLGEANVEVAYNDRSEVVGASYRSGSETRQKFEYDYDWIGNRTTARSAGGPSAVVGGKTTETNALRIATRSNPAIPPFVPIRVHWSNRGLPMTLDGNLLEDARNTYTWDAENRLVRVESKDGSFRLDYVYDHQNRRTVRTETKQTETKNEERRTTYYLYDAWNVLAEIDAVPAEGQLEPSPRDRRSQTLNFKPATLLSWGRDLSGSLQGAGGVGGLLAISKGETHRHPVYDANGNIEQLIDGGASVVAAYIYDPFGNVTKMAGAEAGQNQWRFSAKPVEAGTGWLYYGFRYYQPETGRWASRDPIEERGGVNLYGFISNDPANKSDYLGFQSIGPYSPNDALIVANQRFGEIAKKFIAGTSKKEQYRYKNGDAWTVAIKSMEPYNRLRNQELIPRGHAYCQNGATQLTGKWDVRAVDWGDEGGAEILQAIRDGVNYVFGFELKSLGGVKGDFVISNIDCNRCELTYKFEAGPGSFRFGSLARFPGSERAVDPSFIKLATGPILGVVSPIAFASYMTMPTNEADNPYGPDGPFSTIDIYWSWEETIKM
jgi:RHS repeat-associated protein